MVVEKQHAASLSAGHTVGGKITPDTCVCDQKQICLTPQLKKEGIDKHLQDKLVFLHRAFALNMMQDRYFRSSRRFLSISLNVGAKEAMTGEGSSGCQALIA